MNRFILIFLTCFTGTTEAQLTFAHVSDTHVGNSTGAEDLRRTVADINSLNNLSFVIITGDITESGTDNDFRLSKQILDSLTIPWYIVPGNHDMKWSESGGTAFAKIFGSERFVFHIQNYTFIGLHQGPRMRMGDAYWATEDIRWLDSLLASLRSADRTMFIATHYPADSGIANWYHVTKRARANNIKAFLNGHFHRNLYKTMDGIPSVISRSNLRGRDSFGGYNIVELRNDSMIYSTRITGKEILPPWCTVILNNPMMQSNIPETDSLQRIFQKQYPAVSTRLKTTHESSMICPPAVSPEYLAFAFFDGTISIQSRKGTKRYTFNTGHPILATPAIDKTTIVFSSADSTISCFDFVAQSYRWKFTTRNAVVAPPVIENGIVYCGASDNTFRAISLSTGKLLWMYDSLKGHIESAPLVVNDRIIVGAWDEHLYCFDKKSGAMIWKWKGGRPGTLFSPAACEPVYAQGKIFIVAPDRYMTAIEVSSGHTVWRTDQFKVRETIGISDDRERVYIRTMNDSVYAISTHGEKPSVVWGTDAGFGYDINSSQIREKDGVVFVTTKNGVLIAFNAYNGNILWKFKEENVITHTPVPLSKSEVIFSNIVGTICTVVYK